MDEKKPQEFFKKADPLEKEPGSKWPRMLEDLRELYADVDLLAGRLYQFHSRNLRCHLGCYSCCVDGITVFEVEAENIRLNCRTLFEKEIPHPEGGCAFLNEKGECRIYAYRPYVCRTQGLPLRWIEALEDGRMVEMRDICPLNDPGGPIEDLPGDECWEIGPFEGRLAGLQLAAGGGKAERSALRKLFKKI